MRQMMRQIGEILMPSCGAAIVTGISPLPQVFTCIDVVAPLTADVGETITINAFLKRKLSGDPLGGKTVWYLILPPGVPVVLPTWTPIDTDGNGRVQFDYTVPSVGVHKVGVVFLGEDENGQPLIDVDDAFLLCGGNDIVSCLGENIPPDVIGLPLEQPFCGLGCGQNICDSDGLDPTD